jgi:hypothetical protein
MVSAVNGLSEASSSTRTAVADPACGYESDTRNRVSSLPL